MNGRQEHGPVGAKEVRIGQLRRQIELLERGIAIRDAEIAMLNKLRLLARQREEMWSESVAELQEAIRQIMSEPLGGG